jgi:putative transposase
MCARVVGGRRRTIRWSKHDYGGGAFYLITLCAHKRAHLFGKVVENVVQLSPVGRLVHDLWKATAALRSEVELDAFVIMPNHMHAIVKISRTGSQRPQRVFSRPPRSLGSLIAGYKSACTSRANALLGIKGFKIWQRNYHERVIRDNRALDRMRRYIARNPAQWAERAAITIDR